MTKLRIGLIDNLGDIDNFLLNRFSHCSAASIMEATGGNTGNIAFVHGTKKLLNNQFKRITWGTSAEWVKKNIDLIVVSCANQLGEHVDLAVWAQKLEEFDTPVALIGIGAQSESKDTHPKIPAGTLSFLDIANKLKPNGVCNIVTRGNFTSEVLKNLGYQSLPAGCPSLHITNADDLGSEILAFQQNHEIRKISVAAGNPWHAKSSKLEKTLTDIVDKYSGAYVLQHPASMIELAQGEQTSLSENQINGYMAAYGNKFNKHELTEWYRRNAVLFIDAGNWIQFYKRFDLILGPRYHGVALAIQACRPGTVVSIDSRTEELCDETGIKQISITDAINLSESDLIEACRWTANDAEKLTTIKSKQYRHYTEFFTSIGL